MFLVSVDLCSGFLRSSSLELPLLSVSGFSVYLLTSHTKSFDEFSEEIVVDVVGELVEKTVTTNGT